MKIADADKIIFNGIEADKVYLGASQVWTKPVVGGTLWTPAELGSAVLWFEADSGVTESGGTVSSWASKVGSVSAYHADGGDQPTFVASDVDYNGEPVLDFANTQYMRIPDQRASFSNAMTVFFAGEIRNNVPFAAVISTANTAGDGNAGFALRTQSNGVNFGAIVDETTGRILVDGSVYALATPFMGGMVYNGSTEIVRQAGAQINSAAASGNIAFGAAGDWWMYRTFNGSQLLSGRLASLILTSDALSLADIERVEGYLHHKFGVPIASGHTYESAPPYV